MGEIKSGKWGKKIIACFLTMIVVLTTVFTNNVTGMAAAKAGIVLNSKKETVAVGKSVQLKVKSAKGLKSKAVTWKSSNSKVAKVSSKGKITGVKQGTTKITATSKSNKKVKAICKITVKKDAVKNIGLDKTACVVVKGKTTKVKVNSVIPVSASANVTWKINKSSVAKVTVKGNVATIKGKKSGKATLTATAADGSKKTAKAEVIVVNKKADIRKITEVQVGLDKNEILVGDIIKAAVKVFPSNATLKKVYWSSSDEKIAAIDQNGKIIALKSGTVNITASAQDGSGKKATVMLTVQEKSQPELTNTPTTEPATEVTKVPEVTKEPTVTPTKEPEVTKAVTPQPEVTEVPTATPTKEPEITKVVTPQPEVTEVPTATPTKEPEVTKEVTPQPEITKEPTLIPTKEPEVTKAITPQPEITKEPTLIPTKEPEVTKTITSQPEITKEPTLIPTKEPEVTKTITPQPEITKEPTLIPTKEPEVTKAPVITATKAPTVTITQAPTVTATQIPTVTLAPTKAPTITVTPTQAPVTTEIPTKAWYENVEEAGKALREEMKKRNTTIELKYKTSEDIGDGSITGLIAKEAVKHTGVPTEGDYLEKQMGGYDASISYYMSNNVYYVTITYNVTYFTTAQQEAVVDAKIEEVMQGLNIDGKSDYQKVKAIYDYVCKNVTYDYANLNDDSYMLKYTAYAALIDKTSVCQGYANLIYRMLLEAGIDSRIVTGIGITSEGSGPHAWNIVKLDDKYYYLDATWDASYIKVYSDYNYFLRGTSDFEGHTLDDVFETEEFKSLYPIPSSKME